MFLARLTFLLTLIFSARLGPDASPRANSPGRPIELSAPGDPGPSALDPAGTSSRAPSIVSPDEAAPLENEFEIPDQPDDEEPDNLGDAIRSRSCQVTPISIALASSLDTPIAPGRSSAVPVLAGGEGCPRFLSFRRLLI